MINLFNNKKLLSAVLLSSAFISSNSLAADISVEITNISSGLFFTPILVSAHGPTNPIFMTGRRAVDFPGLKELAESGAIDIRQSDITNNGATVVANPASGFLNPGQSTTATLQTSATQTRLSLAAMILPSNDGFMGINSWVIPTTPGVYRTRVVAYDAGTETNTETRASMPAPAFLNLGTGGTGVIPLAVTNVPIHIHRGNVGDTNQTGGISDINSSTQRWLNPVAEVVLTVR